VALIHLDAGVIIGALDADDAHHLAATAALARHRLAGDRFAMGASAVAEILVTPHRHSPEAVRIVDALLDRLAITVVPVDRSIARRAAAIRAAHPTCRLPDALILATAIEHTADRVITTDRRWPTPVDLGADLAIEIL
jgi:predicted nucleic acid-binding protein